MEIKGILIQLLPEKSGTSQNGEWRKQDFIIETEGEYPKKICVSVWGDLINELNKIQIGSKITVSVNIESREYNSNWYTDVKAWKFKVEQKSESTTEPTTTGTEKPEDKVADSDNGEGEQEDLPF